SGVQCVKSIDERALFCYKLSNLAQFIRQLTFQGRDPFRQSHHRLGERCFCRQADRIRTLSALAPITKSFEEVARRSELKFHQREHPGAASFHEQIDLALV